MRWTRARLSLNRSQDLRRSLGENAKRDTASPAMTTATPSKNLTPARRHLWSWERHQSMRIAVESASMASIHTVGSAEFLKLPPSTAFWRRFAAHSLKTRCNHKFMHLTPTKSVRDVAFLRQACPLSLLRSKDRKRRPVWAEVVFSFTILPTIHSLLHRSRIKYRICRATDSTKSKRPPFCSRRNHTPKANGKTRKNPFAIG